MSVSLILSGATENFEAVVEDGNKSLSKFWKELIPEGTYKHPVKDFQLAVTKERLDSWATKFKRQQELNMGVPLPYGHTYTPQTNAGWTEKVEVRQKANGKYALFGLLDVPLPDDAKKIGTTIKDVSVSITPELKQSLSDGTVENLGEGLQHVALTCYPVIAGMEEFTKTFDKSGEEIQVIPLQFAKTFPTEVVEGSSKLTHAEVGYTSGTTERRCAKCIFYICESSKIGAELSSDISSCTYVQSPIKPVDVCDYFQAYSKFFDKVEEVSVVKELDVKVVEDVKISEVVSSEVFVESKVENFSMTPEQLRKLEARFGLEGDSLTSENVFDTLNSLDFANKSDKAGGSSEGDFIKGKVPVEDDDIDSGGNSAGIKKSGVANKPHLPNAAKKMDKTTSDNDADDEETPPKKGVNPFVKAAKGMSNEELYALDISQHPQMLDMQTNMSKLTNESNARRVDAVNNRVKAAMQSGRMNKAVLTKITGGQTLQFSADAFDPEYYTGVERALDIIETLPPNQAVEVGKRINSGNVADLDIEETSTVNFDAEADKIVKAVAPQYHMDNMEMDSSTGVFRTKNVVR